jgi:hypothetical protein
MKTEYGTFKKITENGVFEAISPEGADILAKSYKDPNIKENIEYAIYCFEKIKEIFLEFQKENNVTNQIGEQKMEELLEISLNAENGIEDLNIALEGVDG